MLLIMCIAYMYVWYSGHATSQPTRCTTSLWPLENACSAVCCSLGCLSRAN